MGLRLGCLATRGSEAYQEVEVFAQWPQPSRASLEACVGAFEKYRAFLFVWSGLLPFVLRD